MSLCGCIEKRVLLADHHARLADWEPFERDMLSGRWAGSKVSHFDHRAAAASKATLRSLRPCCFADLRLDHRHTGCSIEGTVISRPIRFTAIRVLLVDASNSEKAIVVSLYNFLPVAASIKEVRQTFPEGTRLAIKAPYYKTYQDGTSGIRVDHPADVVFLPQPEKAPLLAQPASFDGNKACADTAFRSKHYTTHDV